MLLPIKNKIILNIISFIYTGMLNITGEKMQTNRDLRQEVFNIVDEQIRTNNLPETSETFERLKKEGYSDFEAKQMIGQCISVEMFETLSNKELFDHKRYVENLYNLPGEPEN